MNQRFSGIGMTSQRTRARMVERLRAQGIVDEVVLSAMNDVPRHIFVDEALRAVPMKIFHCRSVLGKRFLNPILWRA